MMARLWVALFLVGVWATAAQATSDTIIPGEYIVRLKENTPLANLPRIFQGSEILHQIEVNRKVVALVRAHNRRAAAIVNNIWVDLVENNKEVRLIEPRDIKLANVVSVPRVFGNNPECLEQENTNDTTFNIWGLIRTSHW